MKGLKNIKLLNNKTCLIYVDFDIEIKNKSFNDRKLRELIDTLEYLSFNNQKIVLFSKNNNLNNLEIILLRLAELLKLNKKFNKEIVLYKDENLENFNSFLNLMNFGDIVCIKNISEYVRNDKEFKEISKYFLKQIKLFIFENFNDFYVDDKFILELLKKGRVVVGFSFAEKYEAFLKLKVGKVKSIAVIGGEYNNRKIDFIETLLKKKATILLGGEVSSVFSFVYINRILKKNKKYNTKSNNKLFTLLKKYKKNIILPEDYIVSNNRYKNVKLYRKNIKDLTLADYIFDIGPETIKKYVKYINKTNCLLWSGLLGIVEDKSASNASLMMSEIFCSKARGRAYGVVVGNRTCNFVVESKFGEDVDYLFYEKDTIYRLISNNKNSFTR